MSKIIEFFKKMWKSVFPGKVEEKVAETPAVVVEERKYFAPTVNVQEIAPVAEKVVPVIKKITPVVEKVAPVMSTKKSAPKKKAAVKKTTNKKKK